MKRILIKKLRIENFKGCKEQNISFSNSTNIYGENASGKTTIMDACMWLLFDKDSTGSAKFNIRPLDINGKIIDNVEILVEAVLDVDGTVITLQKVQKQNWVKKRGTDVTTLQGNINTYEIDSFPASEREFKEKIETIISEDLFKLLTDPRAFANLSWKKQREILLNFISEITDADVLATDIAGYAPIEDDVKAAPIEKCIEKAKKAMAKLKERQRELPARIDEASKSLVQVSELTELELQRNALNEQLEEIQSQQEDAAQAYKVVADIQAEIMKTKLDIGGIEQRAHLELDNKRREVRRIYNELESKSFELFESRKKKEREIEQLKKSIDQKEMERSDLGEKYKKYKAMVMDKTETVCKFCGQKLPEDRMEQVITDFEKNKATLINKVLEKGRAVKSQIDDAKEKIALLESEITALKKQWYEITNEKNKEYEAMNAIPTSVNISENQEYQALQLKLSNLETQLANMDTGEKLKQQLRIREKGIREELDGVNKSFAAVDMNEKIRDRIAELRNEQKEIGQKVANQEQKIFLLEKFSRAKMEMLSKAINSKFQIVNFKMWEMQLNGGMKDTCEMTVDGIPYSSLNSAAKMQAGIDVIHSLSQLYEVSVPVWLDNRESVTNIPEVECQVINLFVSPMDKELRVEVA